MDEAPFVRFDRSAQPVAEFCGSVLPSKALSSVERLDIYAYMYYARLIEVLENEYPTTQQFLGADPFRRA